MPSQAINLRRSTDKDRRRIKRLVSLQKFLRDEQGVAALEYVLIISVAVILVAALVGGFGQNIINLFNSVTAAI